MTRLSPCAGTPARSRSSSPAPGPYGSPAASRPQGRPTGPELVGDGDGRPTRGRPSPRSGRDQLRLLVNRTRSCPCGSRAPDPYAAASYLWRGMVGPATFSLLSAAFRPAGRPDGHGLEDCLTFLERFHFDEDERARLGDTLGFNEPALDAFRRLRFTGEVWAVPEGRMVFAGEPLLGVTAPIAEAQLVEIVLLNQVTFHTAVASKAARCRIAAASADLVDFAFRRTHGVDAAMAVARASAIVGFVATSNVEAARRFGLQAAGTMAHSFIEAFPDQRAAFRAFAEDYPGRCTFLVDTYDT